MNEPPRPLPLPPLPPLTRLPLLEFDDPRLFLCSFVWGCNFLSSSAINTPSVFSHVSRHFTLLPIHHLLLYFHVVGVAVGFFCLSAFFSPVFLLMGTCQQIPKHPREMFCFLVGVFLFVICETIGVLLFFSFSHVFNSFTLLFFLSAFVSVSKVQSGLLFLSFCLVLSLHVITGSVCYYFA